MDFLILFRNAFDPCMGEQLLDFKAGEISKEINAVVVLKLLPEAFCNLLILKSSFWGVW